MMNENIKPKLDGVLSNKVCIGNSVPTTTPFLLMQTMRRRGIDLQLPPGAMEIISHCIIREKNLQFRPFEVFDG